VKYKLETIKRKKEFEFLFENGKRFSQGNLRLVVFPKSEEEINAEPYKIYYAVHVSKKTSKKSVVRNRIKRLLRESLRFLARNNMNDKLHIFKYIFLGWIQAPQRACEIRLKDVLPHVELGLTSAVNYFSQKEERNN